MTSLIKLALRNPRAVTVTMLTVVVVGGLCMTQIPVDILPVFDRPAVQVITFYSGMPPTSVASTITNPMERWTGTAGGMLRQESRSILGVSIIRNYFRSGVDPNGALTQVNSLALAEIPNLPPGTLPPLVLPFDPTATVPACIVALDSQSQSESTLYDVGRYEVRNLIMSSPARIRRSFLGARFARCSLTWTARSCSRATCRSWMRLMQLNDTTSSCQPATRNSATSTSRSIQTPCLMPSSRCKTFRCARTPARLIFSATSPKCGILT